MSSEADLQADVEALIESQRRMIDQSNIEDFVATPHFAARTDPTTIDRSKHMKAAVVDNQDKQLSRSLVLEPQPESRGFNAIEERVRNLETHLGLVLAPADQDLYARVRVVEEKILKIEQHYPQIAAHCFNYGKAEKEASSRPGGRVSKMDHMPGSVVKKSKKDSLSKPPSIQDLRSKMLDLKDKLIKKTTH